MADLPVVLCYGDSNTHGASPDGGARFGRDVRWPGVLGRRLAGDAHVIEEGLNGRTTIWDDPYTTGRNGREYLLPCLRSHQPIAVLVLMLGTNDIKTLFCAEPNEVALGMMSLVDIALASACGPDGSAPRVLVVAPPGLGQLSPDAELWGFRDGHARGQALAPLYRTGAAARGVAFFDAAAVVTADGADGVHLSAESHGLLAQALEPVVREMLR